jgi:hypothetical protein
MRKPRPEEISAVKIASCALLACMASVLISSCSGASSISGALPPGRAAAGHERAKSAPTSPPQSKFLDDSWVGIHAFQPFDDFDNKNIIPQSQAEADGPLYDAVWGSNSTAMVEAWKTHNPTIRTSIYFPLGTDLLGNQFGDLGHRIGWWVKNYPSWVLYECDEKTVAYVPGIPEVPLDISNPDVVNYLLTTAGKRAENIGYTALSLDFVGPDNPTGGQNGGTRGCGVWTTNGQGQQQWVQKFSGQKVDSAWSNAVLAYLAAADAYLHGLPRPLALWGNNVTSGAAPGDSFETQAVADLDIVNDENGFASYGKYADDAEFNNLVYWATDAQSQGKGFMIAALFPNDPLNDAQIEYAIAGYLMLKEQAATMDAFSYGTYGTEEFRQAYNAAIGSPCGPMYGGPKYEGLGQYVYYRQYTGGIALINDKSAQSYTVDLPQASYTDAVTGATVNSPLQVGPDTGYVLLNAAGCP